MVRDPTFHLHLPFSLITQYARLEEFWQGGHPWPLISPDDPLPSMQRGGGPPTRRISAPACQTLTAAIQDKGHGAVVEQRHFHVSPEDARLDGQVGRVAQSIHELAENSPSDDWVGRLVESRKTTLACIAEQRALANGQEPSSDFGQRAIHFSGLITED